MAKLPAIFWYTGDWLKDPQLSMCSPATRGIWADLIFAMHELGRSGQVTGTVEQLCRICRCTAAEMAAALEELKTTKAANISERDGKVTVINRRMSREQEERLSARERKQKQRGKSDVTDESRKSHANVTATSSCSSSLTNTSVSNETAESDKSDNVPDRPPDVIWDLGVALLQRTGEKESAARSFLGKLRKQYGNHPVSQAIAACSAAQAVDPKAYLTAVLRKGGKFDGSVTGQFRIQGSSRTAANKGRELDTGKSI